MNTELIKSAADIHDSRILLKYGTDAYLREDYETAVKYYSLAAAMGDSQAISNLGYCYFYGRAVEQNYEMAFYYFYISKDFCEDSLYKLGTMYEEGIFVEKDEKRAKDFYNKALKKITYRGEYPSLLYKLGRMELRSEKPDFEKAKEYLEIAKIGYEQSIEDGAKYYQDSYNEVLELLKDERLLKDSGVIEDLAGELY